ncbi:MAG: hypothetical protein ABI247_15145 [Rhodanobacter sp.]
MRYLSILLLTPWLLVLCWIYWAYPRSLLRTVSRRAFDVVVLLLAVITTTLAALAGFDSATLPEAGEFGPVSGAIWQQVLPALYGYAAFTAVLAPALWLRQRGWASRVSHRCAD